MTTQEFSNEFDILYNNIMSNQAPGLDEYEKSVFLTKAQSELLKNYFNPKGNKYQEGFDDSEKRQYDFSKLIRVATLFNINTAKERITEDQKIDRRSIPFIFPEDYFISVNEVISDSKTQYTVIPLTHEEYSRLMLKPYAYPVKKAAWRLFSDKKNCNFYQSYIGDSEVDYKFLSTWADQKRNLHIAISASIATDDSATFNQTGMISNTQMVIHYPFEGFNGNICVQAQAGWVKPVPPGFPQIGKPNHTYEVLIDVLLPYGSDEDDLEDLDDEEVINAIKQAFFEYSKLENKVDGDFKKAYEHTDGFINFTAPSKFTRFQSGEDESNAILTEVIFLPIAEVIGKFSGEVQYKLRYIKKPKPIVLADFTDSEISIEGVKKVTQCELPSELHSEILQRAVELAKAAYAGDINSTIELGKRSE